MATGRPWVSNSQNIKNKASNRVGSPDRLDRPVGRTASTPVPRVIPIANPAASNTPGVSGGGLMRDGQSVSGQTANNGTGQVQYGSQAAASPAPFNIDEVPIETLRLTPEYMARERALQNQLELFRQEQATGRTRFDEDLGKSFSELGFDPTSGNFDLGELLSSGQRATTSGQAFQALRNDFAGRGMLQSGAYEARKGVLRDQLMQQQQELESRRTRFGQDQTAALVAQEEQAKAQRDAALDEARQALLARMGMGG